MKFKTAIDVLNEAIRTKEKKSKDYQGTGIEEADYFPYGRLSFVQMMHTKMLRIKSVSEKSDDEVNNESLEDSLKDMAVYSAMYSAWLYNEKEKEKQWKF